ncbi:hypothetical protein Micbo1qcDRAFT_236898 [Microdochium bolleyi]|uniref:BTB domain-containing protein n=1 Tax=Microdochium bolleyi TaxID=196109 RepID=A0A136INW8_9PEZI|nr:hypothetical protein Micbo1qcDRAFT_236898 [Microdochium bolleyi]
MLQVAMDLPSGVDTMPNSLTRPAMPSVNPSRYSSIVGLRFADQVLHVHHFLLDKAPKLRVLVSTNKDVAIPDTLAIPVGASNLDELRSHFEVYAAATKYQLVGLQKAVQQAIDNQTANLEPSVALAIVKKTCPQPDVADLWLRDYAKALLDATFSDVTSFLNSDLMTADAGESTISITELLLRAVLSSLKAKEERRAEEELPQEQLAEEEPPRDLLAEEWLSQERLVEEELPQEPSVKKRRSRKRQELLEKQLALPQLAEEQLAEEPPAEEPLAEQRFAEERDVREEMKRNTITELSAEYEALEAKRLRKGKLKSKDSTRHRVLLEEIGALMAEVETEPVLGGNESDLIPHPPVAEAELEPAEDNEADLA